MRILKQIKSAGPFSAIRNMDDLIRTLPKLLRAAGETEEVLEAAALAAWKRVAGEGLRAQTVPFRLYRKTLIVAVADITWQKQLEAMSGQLLFSLNSLLGQAIITYIEFRIDPKTVNKERAAIKTEEINHVEQERRALRRVSGEISVAADQIHDEDLRRRFLLAAGSCIDRRERVE